MYGIAERAYRIAITRSDQNDVEELNMENQQLRTMIQIKEV